MKKKDKEELMYIYEEAQYRAIKRFFDEKKQIEEKSDSKDETKRKKIENIFFTLNILCWPWKINKKFKINNQIYDGILVLFVSLSLQLLGTGIWLIGVGALFNYFMSVFQQGIQNSVIEAFGIGILSMVFGSLFILSGKEFSKVTDSNKIYAYSSSLIALMSCVIALISVFR